jgi:hypothetical protein
MTQNSKLITSKIASGLQPLAIFLNVIHQGPLLIELLVAFR